MASTGLLVFETGITSIHPMGKSIIEGTMQYIKGRMVL
jgi:hypothetical protein